MCLSCTEAYKCCLSMLITEVRNTAAKQVSACSTHFGVNKAIAQVSPAIERKRNKRCKGKKVTSGLVSFFK